MKNAISPFVEAVRNCFFGHRIATVLTIGFGLFAVYIVVNYGLLSDEYKDPVYLLTGVERREQVSGVLSLFALGMLIRFLWISWPFECVFGDDRKKGTLLLSTLIFLNSLAASLPAVRADVNHLYWPTLYGWAVLVLAIQTGILAVTLTYIRNTWAHLALLSGFGTLNVLAFYLSFQHTLADAITGGSVLLAFCGFVLLFTLVGRSLIPLMKLNGVLAVAMLAPAAPLLPPAVSLFWPSGTPSVETDALALFDRVKFKSRPDIHIVVVDALSPFRLSEKYLDLYDLPLERLIAKNHGTVFRNTFASHVSTIKSLNSIMRLSHGDMAQSSRYFSGRKEGPVTRILRNNGYKIITGIRTLYLGKKGPFVDEYNTRPISIINSTFCVMASGSAFKFFWVCKFPWRTSKKSGYPEVKTDYPEFVLDFLKYSAEKSQQQPIFTMHYINSITYHTDKNYRVGDQEAHAHYRKKYRSDMDKLEGFTERAIEIVRNNARPTVLFMVGDHGPWLTRNIEFNQDPRFVVEDRYGILIAVLVNNSGCGPDALKRYRATYMTTERLLAALMACISENPEDMDSLMKFDEAYAFKNFLYE